MGKPKKAKLVQLLKKFTAPVAKNQKKPLVSTATSNGSKEKSKRIAYASKTTSSAATTPTVTHVKHIQSKHSFQFEADDSVLLVGEGNFSFAASLMEELSGSIALTATCFDSADVVNSKYPDAQEFIAELADWEATVHYNVDATKLQSVKALRGKRFTKILFNFPHVGGGIKDQDRNVRQNQALISGFLSSALGFMSSIKGFGDSKNGVLFVTTKSGMPYELWDVKALAKANNHLKCLKSFVFRPEAFPRYFHRRTIGFAEGLSATDNSEITRLPSRTFAFVHIDSKTSADNDGTDSS
ncbi:hypothetical protein BSLG_006744 [Batrachochytrium salamandrivorans]|nr:hypothetical protein BSLG_006744 [Batrachochytrium salamandrivorans]